MSWQRHLIHGEERETQMRQGLDKAFAVAVNSTSIEAEKAIVSFYGSAGRDMNIPHPFISTNSWIRGMPESGASMSAWYRADEPDPQAMSYIQRGVEYRLQDYRDNRGIYRPLYPGEIELSSIGYAQSHYSRRAVQDHHAGMVSSSLDQDILATVQRAPTHINQLFGYKSGSLKDSMRVGIVHRPKGTWDVFYPKVNSDFAAEYYLSLLNPSGSNPEELYSVQTGHVLDEKGVTIKSSETGMSLRHLEKFYAKDGTFTTREIDEKGNYLFRTADAAVEGYKVDVANGPYTLNVAKDSTTSIKGDTLMTVEKNFLYQITKDAKFQASNFDIGIQRNLSMAATNFSLVASGSASGSSSGSFSLSADGSMKVSGKGSTVLGDVGSVTDVDGSIVRLAKGATQVALVGGTCIGIGNLSMPVISTIIVGATKTYAT